MVNPRPSHRSMPKGACARTSRARSLIIGLATAALVLAACGGGGGSSNDTTTTGGDGEGGEVAGIDFSGLSLPDGDAYDDYTTVGDDSMTLEVEVPAVWEDVDREPGVDPDSEGEEDAVTYNQILASPDVEAFNTGYSEPGMVVNESPVETKAGGPSAAEQKLNDYANQAGLDDSCGESETFDYDDGTYTGSAELWPECGDDDAAVVAISAEPEQGSRLFVSVQMLTAGDIDAAIRIIETFKRVSAAQGEAGPGAIERIVPDECEAAIEDGETVFALLDDALEATTDAITAFNTGDTGGVDQAIGRISQIRTEIAAAEDAYRIASADCRDVQEATPARCLDALDAGDEYADLVGQALDAADAAIAAHDAGNTGGVDQAIGRISQIRSEISTVEGEWNTAAGECVGS